MTISGIAGAVLGDSGAESGVAQPSAKREDDGSWTIDGRLSLDEFLTQVAMDPLPDEEQGAYHTVAGLIMHNLGRLPEAGETAVIGGVRFRVLRVEGSRIESVSVLPKTGL